MFTLPCPALPCPALPCPALLCPCACRLLLLAISLKSRETSALTETSALLAPRIPANVELRSESNIETKRIVCGFFSPIRGKYHPSEMTASFSRMLPTIRISTPALINYGAVHDPSPLPIGVPSESAACEFDSPPPPLPSNSSGVRLEEPTWSRSARRPEIRRARRTTRKRRSADQATNQI